MSDLIDREALLRQIDIDSEGEPGYYGDTWKFIDTIKSMPPAELGTNCISRQAAIDALKKDMASLDHIIKGMSANDVRLDAYVSQRNQVNYDIFTIKTLPPAEPKRGRWINGKCSECSGHAPFWAMASTYYESNFCPNCGAKMEEKT